MQTACSLAQRITCIPLWIAAILAVGACNANGIVSIPAGGSRTVSVAVGQELRITLHDIGPAVYEIPPQISSSALTFLREDDIGPVNPGGPYMQFSFRAVSTGQAIVHFRQMLNGTAVSFVEDTVEIR